MHCVWPVYWQECPMSRCGGRRLVGRLRKVKHFWSSHVDVMYVCRITTSRTQQSVAQVISETTYTSSWGSGHILSPNNETPNTVQRGHHFTPVACSWRQHANFFHSYTCRSQNAVGVSVSSIGRRWGTSLNVLTNSMAVPFLFVACPLMSQATS